MKTQVIKANAAIEAPTLKLVVKLGVLASVCLALCYLFAAGVSSLASLF